MVDSEEGAEDTPMINESKQDSSKLVIDGKGENVVLLENLAKLSIGFSVLLFVSLTIACIAAYRVDPISIVIGYWLVLFVFVSGWTIKKRASNSALSNLSNSDLDFQTIARSVKDGIGSLILFLICQLKKYVHLRTKNEIEEIIQDGSFCFLAICTLFLGFMVTAGTVLMHIFFTPNDLHWLALKLSFGIWINIQGSIILFSSLWRASIRINVLRMMILLTILSSVAILSVSVYLICGLYSNESFDGRYFNAMSYIDAMLKIGDPYRYKDYMFGGNQAEVVTHWPKDEHGKPNYPNWTLILSLVLQKGPLVPLSAFQILIVIGFILSLIKFGRKDSDLKIYSDDKMQPKNEIFKWILRMSGLMFIMIGLFLAFSGVFVENVATLFYDKFWIIHDYYIIQVNVMCGILIIIGFAAIVIPSKSRHVLVLCILMLSMLSVFSLSIFSLVKCVGLWKSAQTNYNPRLNSWDTQTMQIASWDTMMKNVVNCNSSVARTDLKDKDIYLCENNGNGWNAWNDMRYKKTCELFALHEDDFCNGVFDYPLSDFGKLASSNLTTEKPEIRFSKNYDSTYLLSDCDLSDLFQNRYRNAKYEWQDSNYYGRRNYRNSNGNLEESKKYQEMIELKDRIANAKVYKPWIFIADELNCDPMKNIFVMFLQINMGIDIFVGLVSLLVSATIWKKTKLSTRIKQFCRKIKSIVADYENHLKSSENC